LSAVTIAHLDPVGRDDRALQPALYEPARRGDQPAEQCVIGRREGVLPGLQPRLDIGQVRKIAERHRLHPLKSVKNIAAYHTASFEARPGIRRECSSG